MGRFKARPVTTNSIRQVLSENIGKVLTPELACEIELAAAAPQGDAIDPTSFGETEHDGYQIRAERFADIVHELHPLHEAHWFETETYRHDLELNPDYMAFIAMEKAGRLLQATVRQNGVLVGNMRVFLHQSLHTQTPFASEDTLYLLPECRSGFLASKLIRFVERSLQVIGVKELRLSTKTANRSDVLMRRLGYDHAINGFVKFLGDQHVL